VHEVLILGDSHARGCASEVKHQLNKEHEVFGFINPGSGMKYIKESAKMKMAQLTRQGIVVLWGSSNDVARNNSVVGMKHIRSADKFHSYQCDPIKCQSKYGK
jgi:hypothetical protein